MKYLNRIILLATFLCLGSNAFPQLSISYYSSSLSKIGLSYNITERFWTELRLYSNTILDDITPEAVLCYNFITKERHNVYAGLGANVNYYTGFVLPVGVRFTPLESFDRFSLHIELQPSLDVETDIIIQSAWGLRYTFGKL